MIETSVNLDKFKEEALKDAIDSMWNDKDFIKIVKDKCEEIKNKMFGKGGGEYSVDYRHHSFNLKDSTRFGIYYKGKLIDYDKSEQEAAETHDDYYKRDEGGEYAKFGIDLALDFLRGYSPETKEGCVVFVAQEPYAEDLEPKGEGKEGTNGARRYKVLTYIKLYAEGELGGDAKLIDTRRK